MLDFANGRLQGHKRGWVNIHTIHQVPIQKYIRMQNTGNMDNEYWKKYYEDRKTNNGDIPAPSPFAIFVKSRLPNTEFVLDYGCGNGRDTYYFGQEHTCIGLDPAVKPTNCDWAVFYNKTLKEYNHIGEPFDLIYSRFSLHSVPEEEENYLLDFAGNNCKYIAIECRTKNLSLIHI